MERPARRRLDSHFLHREIAGDVSKAARVCACIAGECNKAPLTHGTRGFAGHRASIQLRSFTHRPEPCPSSLQHPDLLVCSVGTEIYEFAGGDAGDTSPGACKLNQEWLAHLSHGECGLCVCGS